MGGDGGSIPGRADLVVEKKKKLHANRQDTLDAWWSHCQVSQLPLRPPLAVCRLGRLYNKESILELLLDRLRVNPSGSAAHIRTLRDVRELSVDCAPEHYVCPVVGVPMNGRHSFELLWSCGCLLSERAMRLIVAKEDTRCPACETLFDPKEDRTPLYPSGDQERERQNWLSEREQRLALDRAERKANRKRPPQGGDVAVQPMEDNDVVEKKVRRSEKVVASKTIASISLQNDPKSSAVYKNLFTTCDKAKAQPKGNWVTLNPFYY